MKLVSWRNATLVLAVVCTYQLWHGSPEAAPSAPPTAELRVADCNRAPFPFRSPEREARDAREHDTPTHSVFGVKLPTWLARLARQPGEPWRDYRDRVLPLAQTVIAPQRARVARELAPLNDHQRAELDGVVRETATAIEERVMKALASGELTPATFTPMTGVTMTRELLDMVERGNTRFADTLTADQRTQLASQRFDFADYLLFSTRWEDALRDK